ncbi:MAG TPA: hypothetical protein VGK00_11625 [Anaerolineales bacterium]|jgi:hypothetical protein
MSFKTLFQFVEWVLHYALLLPAQRRLLAKRFQTRKRPPSPGRDSSDKSNAPGAGRDDHGRPAHLMAHWVGRPGPAVECMPETSAIPDLAPGLMLVIMGCVIFVTTCSLWFVSQGWVEALYIIPIFIISIFVALLCGGPKPQQSTSRRY